MEKINCLGIMISTDCGMGEKVAHRERGGGKDRVTMAKLWKENRIAREV